MGSRFRLTPPRLKLSENDVEKACLDVLRCHRMYPLRQQSGRFRTKDQRYITVGEPGIPDYVIPAFFLEVKRPGGILSDVQRNKIYQLDKFWDLKTAVVESVEELIDVLAEYEQRKKAGGNTGP